MIDYFDAFVEMGWPIVRPNCICLSNTGTFMIGEPRCKETED